MEANGVVERDQTSGRHPNQKVGKCAKQLEKILEALGLPKMMENSAASLENFASTTRSYNAVGKIDRRVGHPMGSA
jgi:hypothetical protein